MRADWETELELPVRVVAEVLPSGVESLRVLLGTVDVTAALTPAQRLDLEDVALDVALEQQADAEAGVRPER